MSERQRYPAIDGLFTWQEDVNHLIGGKCESCGSFCFPKSSNVHKPGCRETQVNEVLLSRTGKLDSYTIQYYPPPAPFISPDPFEPYAIGLVSLPEGISVLGILSGSKPEDLKTGITVELLVDKLYENEKGDEVLGWKFKPI